MSRAANAASGGEQTDDLLKILIASRDPSSPPGKEAKDKEGYGRRTKERCNDRKKQSRKKGRKEESKKGKRKKGERKMKERTKERRKKKEETRRKSK